MLELSSSTLSSGIWLDSCFTASISMLAVIGTISHMREGLKYSCCNDYWIKVGRLTLMSRVFGRGWAILRGMSMLFWICLKAYVAIRLLSKSCPKFIWLCYACTLASCLFFDMPISERNWAWRIIASLKSRLPYDYVRFCCFSCLKDPFSSFNSSLTFSLLNRSL